MMHFSVRIVFLSVLLLFAGCYNSNLRRSSTGISGNRNRNRSQNQYGRSQTFPQTGSHQMETIHESDQEGE